jgi:hypothetical protein
MTLPKRPNGGELQTIWNHMEPQSHLLANFSALWKA